MTQYRPGDVMFAHTSGWIGRCIRIGQRLRFGHSRYAKWNHCAIIVDAGGSIVEAAWPEVRVWHVDLSDTVEAIADIHASDADRAEVVAFARACVGQHYGWLEIVSIALRLATGSRLTFGVNNTKICSGLVAEALCRTTMIFPMDPARCMPADVAEYLHQG